MLFRPMMIRGVAAAVAVTTLSPTDKDPAITLSGGNLTFTSTNVDALVGARATTSKSVSKLYYEGKFSYNGNLNDGFAFATAAAATSSLFGSDTQSIVYYINGIIRYNGASSAVSSGVNNDVIGCAIDLNLGFVWFSKNGVWLAGNPSAGTGGTSIGTGRAWFPAVSATNGNGGTVNFGATAFVNTPPSGFVAWG